MKKFFTGISFLVLAVMAMAQVVVRYYVGDTAVDKAFWDSIPDSLKVSTSHYDNDTVEINSCELSYTHFIDSVSTPGVKALMRRPEADIAIIEAAMGKTISRYRTETLRVKEGESAPQITLVKNVDGSVIENVIIPGKCYLFTFWATWCGNCLKELQPRYIPAVVAEFEEDSDFVFLPICIDATIDDLTKFFSSTRGKKWSYLASITALDTERVANSKYGEPGVMPLNVVVGKTGKIAYIHSGAILNDGSLATLKAAIQEGLK